MSQYLLDTNQLSAAVFSPNSAVRDAIATRIKSGDHASDQIFQAVRIQLDSPGQSVIARVATRRELVKRHPGHTFSRNWPRGERRADWLRRSGI